MSWIGKKAADVVTSGQQLANGTVTAIKLAAGAVVAHLGYTPVNKAGDTISGNLKVQVFGNATSSVQYGNGLEAKMGAYAAETNVELPSPSALFKIRARAGAFDTVGLTATYSGTERDGLLVDNLGRVTTPSQPAFRVGLNSTQSASITPAPFDQMAHNRGSCYNPTSYRFTAPVAGTYLFHLSQNYLSLSSADIGCTLRKNGSPIYSTDPYSVTVSRLHVDSTVILSLAANDYIDVQFLRYNGSGNLEAGSTYGSFFEGVLLG